MRWLNKVQFIILIYLKIIKSQRIHDVIRDLDPTKMGTMKPASTTPTQFSSTITSNSSLVTSVSQIIALSSTSTTVPPNTTSIPQENVTTISTRYTDWEERQCPANGVIVKEAYGSRLEYNLFLYASVKAVSLHHGIPGFVPTSTLIILAKLLEDFSLEDEKHVLSCIRDNCYRTLGPDQWVQMISLGIEVRKLQNQYFITPWPNWFFEKEVLAQLSAVRQEFLNFTPEMRLYVDMTLKACRHQYLRFRKNKKLNLQFVGLHIPLQNYVNWELPAINLDYISHGMQYFREKFPFVFFVIACEDKVWCSNNFKGIDIKVITNNNEGEWEYYDFAVLASCNHSIFYFGNYGLWTSVLAGGTTVVPKIGGPVLYDKVITESFKRLLGWIAI